MISTGITVRVRREVGREKGKQMISKVLVLFRGKIQKEVNIDINRKYEFQYCVKN